MVILAAYILHSYFSETKANTELLTRNAKKPTGCYKLFKYLVDFYCQIK